MQYVTTLMQNALEDEPKKLVDFIKTASDAEVWAQVRSAPYEYRGEQKCRFTLILVNDPVEVTQLHELILKGKELGETSTTASSLGDSSIDDSSVGDSSVVESLGSK